MIQSPPQLTFLQTADKSDVCTKTNSPLTDDSTKHRVISRRSTGSWTVCCHDSGYKTGCFQRDLRASPVHLVEVGPPPAAFEVSVAVSKTVWLSTGKESKHIQVCDVSYVKARVLRWKHQLRWKQRCTCIIYSEYYLLRPGKRKKTLVTVGHNQDETRSGLLSETPVNDRLIRPPSWICLARLDGHHNLKLRRGCWIQQSPKNVLKTFSFICCSEQNVISSRQLEESVRILRTPGEQQDALLNFFVFKVLIFQTRRWDWKWMLIHERRPWWVSFFHCSRLFSRWNHVC